MPAIGSFVRSAAVRVALRAAIAAGVAVGAVATPRGACAELVLYRISGTIEDADAGLLFPGKSAGQTFHGTFTIDTDPLLESYGNGGTLATYTGAFAVVIEGHPLPVLQMHVWSSGPAGIEDGIELVFSAGGGETGFLSLRSSEELYLLPFAPVSIDLEQMDAVADVSVLLFPALTSDRGEIEELPEPTGASFCALAVIAALAISARSRITRVV